MRESEQANKVGEADDSEENDKCGCFAFKPRCLQFFNTIRWHVMFQCVFNFFEGFVVNGVINVVLVALEKRYLLPSSKSGLIASSNDFGAVVCCVLVGYFGEQRHKPKLMGLGILFMIIGCFTFSLPQFIGDSYQYTVTDVNSNSSDNMCNLERDSNFSCPAQTDNVNPSYTGYYALLLLGNILLGIGASPMFTIGLTYIDENCKTKMTSFYISLTFTAAAIGVAVGYVVGGQTLSLFVDIDKVDSQTVPLTPTHPQWVGAWWVSPLIALVGFLVVFFPICAYPRRLPSYKAVQKTKISEAHGGDDELTAQVNFGKSWKDFPASIKLLVTNPTYVFICFGAAVEALIIGGMATFGAKLIQEKFNVDITYAGTLMGIITIPGSGGGMLLGGYLVKRFHLKCRGILRMCAGFMITALCFGPFLLAACPGDPVAGIDKPYRIEETVTGLTSACNEVCECTTKGFEPMCVEDVVYFSPCHAGCVTYRTDADQKIYEDCSCVTNMTSKFSNASTSSLMEPGLCSDKCDWMYMFLALFLVVMILTFATMSPGVTALFRCVPDKQRSVGIGVNLLFVRLVGTMPGPVLLGAIIDSSCTIWQHSCGVKGSCWMYDKSAMGIRIMLWFMGLKILGSLFFLVASFVYKPPSSEQNVNVSTLSAKLDEKQSIQKAAVYGNSQL